MEFIAQLGVLLKQVFVFMLIAFKVKEEAVPVAEVEILPLTSTTSSAITEWFQTVPAGKVPFQVIRKAHGYHLRSTSLSRPQGAKRPVPGLVQL